MGKMIPLRVEPEPTYITGPALCLSCRHTWQGVWPEGTRWLECPSCGLTRGAALLPIAPETFWVCACGFHLFYVGPDGLYCPNCGKMQDFSGVLK